MPAAVATSVMLWTEMATDACSSHRGMKVPRSLRRTRFSTMGTKCDTLLHLDATQPSKYSANARKSAYHVFQGNTASALSLYQSRTYCKNPARAWPVTTTKRQGSVLP